MKVQQKYIWTPLLCAMVSVFACVTINIYFPAEKVESVAGDIVHDIRGDKGGENDNSLKNEKNSLLIKTLLALGPALLALGPASAWADEVTAVSNPTIRALKEKLKGLYQQMKPYYQKGMLKEDNNGYVSLGDIKGLGLKEKRDLKTLVDTENKTRKGLYGEVAKALKIDSSQVNKIAEIFAKEWQKPVK